MTELAITYLGQVGFLFEGGGGQIAIDPYLTDSVDHDPNFPPGFWRRNYPPPLRAASLRDLDLVLCTHDHLDHLDPETLLQIAAASPGCRFAGPRPSASIMMSIGIDPSRIVTLNAGSIFALAGVSIAPVAAAHETVEIDEDGFNRFLGYVLSWPGLVVYHAGDTLDHPGLAANLPAHGIDVGFLPINGRDAQRGHMGILGNLDSAEAIALAARHQIGLLVPTHYDLYPSNGASLAEFVALLDAQAPRQRFKAFRPGERIICRSDPNRGADSRESLR
jgi:L-ascorbate 6-phosphate lactonase